MKNKILILIKGFWFFLAKIELFKDSIHTGIYISYKNIILKQLIIFKYSHLIMSLALFELIWLTGRDCGSCMIENVNSSMNWMKELHKIISKF